MRYAKTFLTAAATLATSVFASAALLPTVAYDNTNPSADLGATYPTGAEYGDEINLAPFTYRNSIQSFEFQYYANYSFNGGGVFRLYANDGALISGAKAPGTLIYESSKFDVKPGYNQVKVDFATTPQVPVPDRLTWAVSFSGVSGANEAGVLIYDKPTVGTSGNDFWVKNGSTWSLQTLQNGTAANFNARLVTVPEPSTWALLAAGTLGVAYVTRRNRK